MISQSNDLPEDPEAERSDILYRKFLDLGFTMTEAKSLAGAWANPEVVSWEMSRGCSYRQAVEIYT